MLPLTVRRLIAAPALVIFLAAVYDMATGEFIPTPLMVDFGLVAGAGLAALAAFYGWTGTFRVSQTSNRLGNNRFLRTLVFGALSFWFGFHAFAAGLPALYTKAAGTAAEHDTVVDGWHSRGRRSCAGPDIPEASSFTTRLCWSQKLANGTKLALKGEESPLGFEVEDFGPRP